MGFLRILAKYLVSYPERNWNCLCAFAGSVTEIHRMMQHRMPLSLLVCVSRSLWEAGALCDRCRALKKLNCTAK
jgi:hypothetical protein